jgi:hypothetical protein
MEQQKRALSVEEAAKAAGIGRQCFSKKFERVASLLAKLGAAQSLRSMNWIPG